ncbi:hypothetical protein LUZ61_016830 [Rhynchospora tenuis]|uniref:protein-serine/threonine phosphatase n=1 Tax=Rhynchospora tenuis TaxID=198213 RepID=A0AAD5Z698_9POAL|nr:hypothetical protein LUZ61_016830 [Rhynchospora tenuis]
MVGRIFSRLFGSSGSDDNPITSIQGIKGSKIRHYQWQKKLGRHLYGQYSMALAQANLKNEDRCQLVSGPLTNVPNGPAGVFVGIYDGHEGNLCSQFVLDNLFNELKTAFTNHYDDEVDPSTVIQEAYLSTENKFVEHARTNWQQNPKLASVGSCCLSGVMHGNMLYVANVGDSRAVVASWADGEEQPEVEILSTDHNTKFLRRRQELIAEHPNDPDLFTITDGIYRVRGSVQVTRAFGDVYLKFNEFNRPPLEERFRQERAIGRPILKAEPTVRGYQLGPDDRFVIFGSDGLWRGVTSGEAVSIVKASPRYGAAKALLKKSLDNTVRRNNLRYKDLRYVPLLAKRYYHDDVSVVILFFDELP